MKRNFIFFTFLFFFLSAFLQIVAQELRVIDNKGTLRIINKITTGTGIPPISTNDVRGDLFISTDKTYVFNGSTWIELPGETITGTTGSIFFADTNGTPTEDNAQLFWDDTNNRLRIGATLSGTNKLSVNGTIRATGFNNADGTVGLPSYRFSDDSDTGIYSPAANQIAFSTGSGNRLNISNTEVRVFNNLRVDGSFIDSSGDTGTAGQILSSTATGTDWINNSGNNNWLLTGNAGTNASTNFLGTTDNNDLVLKTNNIERIRFGQITFPNSSEILINSATPNSFPRAFPLIMKANGTSILGFEDSESNDFWDWSLFKQGHLSLQLRSNPNPRIVFLKNPWNGVGIGGDPASSVNFHVHGNVRIDNLANVSSFDKFVVAEADGDLRSIDPSGVYSTVTQTVTSGNEIAKHIAGSTTTIINETVTNMVDNGNTFTYTNEAGTAQVISKHTVGDIKYGVQNGDHSGWYLLDGRSIASLGLSAGAQTEASNLLGTNLPNAIDRVLKHPSNPSQTILSDGGSATTTLTRPNLPSGSYSGSTDPAGEHSHRTTRIGFTSERIRHFLNSNRNYANSSTAFDEDTSEAGDHSHPVNIDLGGTDQPFPNYQPYLVVNTFIYLGN